MLSTKSFYSHVFSIVFLLYNTLCFSQNIRYEDCVYNPNIKSVQLHDSSFEISQAIIALGSQQKLKLSFDDLDADLKNYSYTIIHCGFNWQPSDLVSADYMDGFADYDITDYQYSINTLENYTHYNLVFPNSTMRITKSGNYILKVYLSDYPDNVILTRRFMVYQNKVTVNGKVNAPSVIADRNYKQEIDFTINTSDFAITNPFDDVKVAITQNNHWDNAKTTLKPSLVNDTSLIYNYEEDNVFSGGNEFRNFDTKTFQTKSIRISKIIADSATRRYLITLLPDERRTFLRYSSVQDINGNYLIKNQDGNNSEVDADYCYVNFFLPYDSMLAGGNLYVFGAYNGWQCNSENVLKYNDTRKGYEATIFFKQGYYNYEYVFLKDGETACDETVIEGMHFETENDYAIYVYYRSQGAVYDQLIGMARLNSRSIN